MNLLDNEKISIKIIHKSSPLTITLYKSDTFSKMKDAIVKLNIGYSKKSHFNVFSGKYILPEILDDVTIDKLNHSFLSNEYKVFSIQDQAFIQNEIKSAKLEDLLIRHKHIVDEYLDMYDVESNISSSYMDMDVLAKHLNKLYQDICREEDYLKKNGLLYLHDQMCLQVDDYTAKQHHKQAYLDSSFIKILRLKSSEKEAVDQVRENKKLVAHIHSNNLKINKRNKEVNSLMSKCNY
jgi:hypothetical protein